MSVATRSSSSAVAAPHHHHYQTRSTPSLLKRQQQRRVPRSQKRLHSARSNSSALSQKKPAENNAGHKISLSRMYMLLIEAIETGMESANMRLRNREIELPYRNLPVRSTQKKQVVNIVNTVDNTATVNTVDDMLVDTIGFFRYLPNELLTEILQQLDLHDVVSVASTCWFFRNMVYTSQQVWHNLLSVIVMDPPFPVEHIEVSFQQKLEGLTFDYEAGYLSFLLYTDAVRNIPRECHLAVAESRKKERRLEAVKDVFCKVCSYNRCKDDPPVVLNY